MGAIRILFGVLMLLMAGWMLTRIMPSADIVHGLRFHRVTTVGEVNTQLAKAKRKGKPVLVDFFANWCIDCKLMERQVFADSKVQKELAAFVLLKADVTKNDQAARNLEQHFNVVAPPTFIFFNAHGKELKKYQLIGKMDAKSFYKYLLRIHSG